MANLTPMMQQYLTLKEKYSDCLLFFRLGDFYEMFFDDAVLGSKEMELTLTGRDCGMSERAPMCGVPYHSVNTYINKLINKGYKVAICEKLQDPALAQGLVERDVIRVITPGTVIEETMLDEKQNNYIAAVYARNSSYGLAYCDVSTGDFFVMKIETSNSATDVFNELDRICPRELIANPEFFENEQLAKQVKNKFYTEKFEERYFELRTGLDKLLKHFQVATLSGFGIRENGNDINAAGALMGYLEDTQKNALVHISKLSKIRRSEYMLIDAATRRNLELTDPLRFDGDKKGTLLYVLDKTKTSMGGRLLRKWIDSPLQLEERINSRLDSVEALTVSVKERDTIAALLAKSCDIERLSSRIAYGTVSPRDCRALCVTLQTIPHIKALTSSFSCERLASISKELDSMDDIFRESDFVSIHVTLTPETRNLVTAKQLALMKPSAYLINIARGPIVNEHDLCEALNNDRIAGAAVDVFCVEPTRPEDPIFKAKNLITTPHTAGIAREAITRMSTMCVEGCNEVAHGRPSWQAVDQRVFEHPRFKALCEK